MAGLGRRLGMGILGGLLAGIAVQAAAAEARFAQAPTWQDEFEYTGRPDPAKWGYDTGGHGWGNHELQTYTRSEDNAFVRDGLLHVVAKRQSRKGNAYTSARLVSKGRGDFLYGRIEVRARIPAGLGTWPAIWMLPSGNAYGGWPKSGEIDIMEHVGFDQDVVHVSVHTEAYNHVLRTQKTATQRVPGASSDFHVYRVDWTPGAILGFIDGEQMYEFRNEGAGPAAWPFDQPFHLLLNVAVGGDWGGMQGIDPAAFPATMEVDYVRVDPLLQP